MNPADWQQFTPAHFRLIAFLLLIGLATISLIGAVWVSRSNPCSAPRRRTRTTDACCCLFPVHLFVRILVLAAIVHMRNKRKCCMLDNRYKVGILLFLRTAFLVLVALEHRYRYIWRV